MPIHRDPENKPFILRFGCYVIRHEKQTLTYNPDFIAYLMHCRNVPFVAHIN